VANKLLLGALHYRLAGTSKLRLASKSYLAQAAPMWVTRLLVHISPFTDPGPSSSGFKTRPWGGGGFCPLALTLMHVSLGAALLSVSILPYTAMTERSCKGGVSIGLHAQHSYPILYPLNQLVTLWGFFLEYSGFRSLMATIPLKIWCRARWRYHRYSLGQPCLPLSKLV